MGRRGLRKAKRVGHCAVGSLDTTDNDKRLVENTKGKQKKKEKQT